MIFDKIGTVSFRFVLLGLVFTWLMLAHTVRAEDDCSAITTLSDVTKPINIAPKASAALHDPLAGIEDLKFVSTCDDYFTISGSHKTVLWMEFTLQNQSSQHTSWAIRLESVTIEQMRLYEVAADGSLTQLGEYYPGAERTVPSLKPALAFSLRAGETKKYQVSVIDPVQGQIVAAVTPYNSLAAQTLSEIVQIVIATGFFFGLFFVTLFWRRHVRNLATVYYCSYLFFIAVGNLFYHDIPSLIGLSIGDAQMNFIIRNSMEVLASFAMMSFTYELLSLKKQTPRLAVVFKILSLVPQATLLVLVWIIPSNGFSVIFGDTIGFLSLSCLLLCLFFAFKRQRTAQILSVSFIVLMSGIIISQSATDPIWAFSISDSPIQMYQAMEIWIYQVTLMLEACLIFLACNQHSKELKEKADAEVLELQTQNTSYEKKLAAALARNKFSGQTNVAVPSAQDRFLSDAVNIIHRHISDDTFGVVTLASELAVSDRTLRRKIKAATDLSPINFIQQQRILVAHDLMQQKAYATVNEVAYAVGFSSPSHFTKLYKETFEASPAAILRTVL